MIDEKTELMKLFTTLIATLLVLVGFAQNNLPTLTSATPGAHICANSYTDFFTDIIVEDLDGNTLTFVDIQTTTPSTIDLPGSSGYLNYTGQSGESHFVVYGYTLAAGTISIQMRVSDGIDTATLILPDLTSVSPASLSLVHDTLVVCSSYGLVDLNENVSLPGGTFNLPSSESTITDGIFDPIYYNITEGQYYDVYYSTSDDNGCSLDAEMSVIYFASPTVTIATTNTTCGGATGTAIATIAGGAPITSSMWSNGNTNVLNVSNLAAGQYLFTVVDTNTCQVDQSFTIDPAGVTITPTVTPVLCNGQANGAISITATGLAAPVSYLWSSGQTGTSVSGLTAGSYTVYATDANNCTASKVIVINQPDVLSAEWNMTFPTCGQADGTMQVDNITGGTAPYTIQWSNGSTSNPENNVAFGLYSVTITDGNGCQTIQPFYMSDQSSADLYGEITPTTCGASLGAIDVDYYIYSGDTAQSIQWSNGATTEDIMNLSPNIYVCTLTVANTGCRAIKGWNVPIVQPLRQDICVVTVDSLTTTNLVVWERVQPIGIVYYNIYRETSTQGQFILIDTVQSTNLSVFNDVIASPNERSWSYKISAVNACGTEGPKSLPHKTIHLDLVDNGPSVTVNWNAYVGTTDFTEYIVWRYSDANGWEQIATVPSSVLSYTDNVPYSTPGLDYMVEFTLSSPCSAEKAQDFNTVRSNRERGQFTTGQGTGVSNNGLEEMYLNAINLYPNPTQDKVTFIQEGNEQIVYTLRSLSGQEIMHIRTSETQTEMDLSSLQAGMYLLEMNMGSSRITKRIVKL